MNYINKPKFNNTPNDHFRMSHITSQGNVGLDYWISRAPAVVGVIFGVGLEGGTRVLIIKRSATMPDEPNKFALPSGYLDWDETGFDGIVREVYEETSIYIPDYDPFLISNNKKQPFYVHTDPTTDKNQNVSLTYIFGYDFSNDPEFFPNDKTILNFTNDETAKVEWLSINDFYNNDNREWGFHHDERIRIAHEYFIKNIL